mgnify:CR=1 FL=1
MALIVSKITIINNQTHRCLGIMHSVYCCFFKIVSAVTTKEITMPQVGKKKFSYSKTGKAKAKAYAKKTGYRVKRKK